jgi:hypothetical protein
MTEIRLDRQRFSMGVAQYVNGSLDDAEHAWFDAYLADNLTAQQELQFVQHLSRVTKSTASCVPEVERLAKLLSSLPERPPRIAIWQRLIGWRQQQVPIPAPAMALGAVLFLGQAAIIGTLLTAAPAQDTYRGGERPECMSIPSVRVVFKPDVQHVEVLMLLRKLELTIQNGPSETGELWLTASKNRSLEDAHAMLRVSPMIEEAVITPANKLAPGCPR